MNKFLILLMAALCSLSVNAQTPDDVKSFSDAKSTETLKKVKAAVSPKVLKVEKVEKVTKPTDAAKTAKSKKAPAKYSFAGGIVNIPKGFEGPEIDSSEVAAKTITFKKPHKGSDEATLMKIRVFNPGKKLPDITNEQLKKVTKHYLHQYFAEIPRTTMNLRVNDIEFMEVSGLPMARIKWIGERQSSKLHGAMYCYIFDSKIILFQAQDIVAMDGVYISKVMGAFESVNLKLLTRG